MPKWLTITTPENARIEYELAGAASRGGAAIMDLLIQGAAVMVLVLLRQTLLIIHKWPGTMQANAILGIVVFLLIWGYYVFFEAAWNGQTPGKRYLRLRVVRAGGLPVDLQCAAVRNLVRFVDLLPFFYVVGAITLFLTRNSQRLGDLAAGTLVVKERSEWKSELAPPETPAAVPAQGATCVKNLELVTPQEFDAAKRYLERKAEFDPAAREQIAARIAQPIMRNLGMNDDGRVPYSEILTEIYSRCTAERGMR